MRRKASAKQLWLDIDTSERERVVYSLDVDLRAVPIGRIVGDGMRVIRCPRCGMGCVVERTERAVRFVHQGLIGSTSRTTHWKRLRFCQLDKEAYAAAVASGRIRVNRLGQILEVTA